LLTNIVLRSIARWNRTLLVAGTALLAVGASQVSTQSPALRAWLWVIGGMALLYVSDVGREIESATRALSSMSRTPQPEIRSDLFGARSSPWLAVLAAAAVGLIIIGLVSAK